MFDGIEIAYHFQFCSICPSTPGELRKMLKSVFININTKKMRITNQLVTTLLVFGLSSVDVAASLIYNFDGKVTSSPDPAITLNESYTGTIKYNPLAPFSHSGSINSKSYADPALQFDLVFSTVTLSFLGGLYQVVDPIAGGANLGVVANGTVSTTGTMVNYQKFNMDFIASAGTFAPDLKLPSDLASLTLYGLASATVDTANNLIFTTENFAGPVVPEPTTFALMSLGLAGIGYKRHCSKKAA